jgi:hypothetical protein
MTDALLALDHPASILVPSRIDRPGAVSPSDAASAVLPGAALHADCPSCGAPLPTVAAAVPGTDAAPAGRGAAVVAMAAAQAHRAGSRIAASAVVAAGHWRRIASAEVTRLVDHVLDVVSPASAPDGVGGRNVAGASAQAEFERRRARHRRRSRLALPLAVAAVVIATCVGFAVVSAAGVLVAALGAAAVGVVGLWLVTRLPADVLTPGRAAAAERRTAGDLVELEAGGYVLLHDRAIPGTRGNVDHLAIGPAGVYVVESKNLRGKLTIAAEKLFVGERTRTGVIDETYRAAIAVQVCLADRLNEARATVHPILCVNRTTQLLLDNEVQGVRVVSGPQLARFLRRQPEVLDAATVQSIADLADRRLPPALA